MLINRLLKISQFNSIRSGGLIYDLYWIELIVTKCF